MNSSRNDEGLKNLLKNIKNAGLAPQSPSQGDKTKLRSDSTCSTTSSSSKVCLSTKSDQTRYEKQSIQSMIKSHPFLVDLSNSKQKCKLENDSDLKLDKINMVNYDDDEEETNENEADRVTDSSEDAKKLNYNNNNDYFNCTFDDDFDYRKMISKTNCNKTKIKTKQDPSSKFHEFDNPCSSDNIKKKFHRSNRVYYNGYLNKQDNKCYQNMPEYQTHASDLLQFLKSLWSDKKMCDLSIVVCNRKYPAHKIGLAMFSKKYREEFQRKGNESSVYTICLKNSTIYAVEAILNYIYTAKIDINPSNVEEILNAAKELGIEELICMSNDYLSSLSIGDVLDYMGNIINKEGSELMFYELYVYFMTHLDKISRTPEFLKSSINVVNALLSDSHLCVGKEMEVFEACVRWLEYDASNRSRCLAELFKNVRFTLICPEDLVSKVENSINLNDTGVYKLVYNSYKYHALSLSKLTNFSKREESRNECLKGASVPDSFVKAIRELSEIAHKLKAARAYTSNKILD